LNDGTETTHAAKTVTAPATTVGAADFPANPTRNGYNFGNWNTAQNGTGTPFTASTTVSADITVYAQWTATPPGSHTVTFKLNDGTDANCAVKYVSQPTGTVTDFPASPTWPGYNFGSWNTAADGTGTAFTAATTVSADITVYARWTAVLPDSRTVTFKMNNGTDADWALKYVVPPAALGADFPADPTRTGYKFGSWNTAANGTGTAFTAATTVSGNITVYAVWESYSYTVSFNNNGGDTEAVPGTKTVATPAATVDALPAPPSRVDYNFGSWNTEPDGSGTLFTAATIVTGDTTVYAQWTTTLITLNPDAGDGAFSQESFTVYKGGDPGSQTVTITGTGYANPQWFVDGGLMGTGTGVTIDAADYSLGNHTLSLLVSKNGLSWSKEIAFTVDTGTLRTVLFRANDGTGAVYAVRTAAAGSSLSGGFPGAPGRDGYDFDGWNTLANGLGTAFTGATTVSADTTVYAQWTGKTYTVTFMRNYDGLDTTVLDTKTVTVPAATIGAAFPGNPTRGGYNFAGWNTQPNGSGAAFGQSSEVNGDITVYAGWVYEQFNITLNADDGDGAFSQVTFTVSKGGGTGLQTVTVTGSGYTNPRWFVDGELAGTDSGIDISAADYTVGGHSLTLLITKGGVSWSKDLSFTVDAGTLRTVLFRANDGTGAVYAVRTTTAGSSLEGVFPGEPGRDGYDFDGWNTQAGGGGSAFTGATTVSADTTVYAQWTGKTYTVNFMRNYDGLDTTVLDTKQVTVPAVTLGAAFPAAPTRSLYNFAGWNTQPDGSGAAFGQTTEIPGNMTVYAGWAHVEFNITLDTDAGGGALSQGDFTLSGGQSQTVTLTGSGYTNPRWFVDGDLAGTGNSVTIDAADYTAGGHSLTLLITKGGVSWSKEIAFTVTN
jgi:uncharacterized repeat protein (TIGR02543 family)